MKQLTVSLIGTFLFMNCVLILFLWERNAVKISNDIPSIAKMNSKPNTSEIITEKVNSSKQGDYVIEDYESIEVWYDQKGNIVKRISTGEHTYLRYWASKKGKVIMDNHDDE